MDIVPIIPFFISPILAIIPLVLLYFVIRLAVRHGIESSDVGMMLREKIRNEKSE